MFCEYESCEGGGDGVIGGGCARDEERALLALGMAMGLETEFCVEVAINACLASSIASTHSLTSFGVLACR